MTCVEERARPSRRPVSGLPEGSSTSRRYTLPIGAIAQALEKRLTRGLSHVDPDRWQEAVVRVYSQFDSHYARRPDYRLWRLAMPPYYAGHRPELYPDEAKPPADWGTWDEAATAAASSRSAVVTWSMLALCSEVIQRRMHEGETAPGAPIWAVVDLARQLLSTNLAPLTFARASCGIAAAMTLVRCQNICAKAGRPLDVDGCSQFVKQFTEWLRIADEAWSPGEPFNLGEFFEEHNSSGRLLTGRDNYQFTSFTNMLAVIRPTVSMVVHELTEKGDRLIKLAYRYSMTAWLTARAHRLHAMENDQDWGSNHRSWSRYERAFLEEFICCLNASNAARDAGEYLESGKLLYLLFRLVPDEFRYLPEVRQQLKSRSLVFRYLKELGLEPDPRFAGDPNRTDFAANVAWQRCMRGSQWRGGGAVRNPEEPRPRHCLAPATELETGFPLRLRKEQETLTPWHTLLTDIPPGPGETPVGYLLTVTKGLADHGFEATPRARVAGFMIALRYGYVRSAGKILARIVNSTDVQLAPWMVSDFVRAVSRCTALDPFGIREKWFIEWRKLIRAASNELYRQRGTQWMAAADRHLIHETLNNRFHVCHANLGEENSRRLFEKSIGAYDLSDLREFYDRHYDFRRRSPDVSNIPKIAAWLNQLGRPAMGAPIALSLVHMGAFVSILAIGRSGEVATEDCPAEELDEDIEALLSEAKFWFKTEGSAATEVGWPGSLRRLAESCARAARRCDGTATVFLISMDSAFARLPWQILMNRDIRRMKRLVSILPSLTAMTLDEPWQVQRGLTSLLSEERTPEIAMVLEAVSATIAKTDLRGASVCIAVGHGVLPEKGGLPGLEMGNGNLVQTPDEWLSRDIARINIFHCCHSGVPEPLFMDEFGGLVGMTMYLGAKTFVAPIAEVLPGMAVKLQRALFHHPRNAVGAAYLAAINAVAGCSLYSLFGNPYESIVPDNRRGTRQRRFRRDYNSAPMSPTVRAGASKRGERQSATG